MAKPLSAADAQRRDRDRAATREREVRRFLVTLGVGAIVFVAVTVLYPSSDRGPAYVGLLVLGLVLALLVGRLVDETAEQRRKARLAPTKRRRR